MVPTQPAQHPQTQTNFTFPAFDMEKSISVRKFLNTLNSTNFNEMKRDSSTVRAICSVAAVAFACAAAIAYTTAHPYVAIGLGITTVIVLVAGLAKGVRVSHEFASFSKSCTETIDHLRDAHLAKAIFIIAQDRDENIESDLCSAYDSKTGNEVQRLNNLTPEQYNWKSNHGWLIDIDQRVSQLKVENIKDPVIQGMLQQVIEAIDVVCYGQTPRPSETARPTYVYYPTDGSPITTWPSAGVDQNRLRSLLETIQRG